MLEIVAHIRNEIGSFRPRAIVVLGSGLGFFAEEEIDAKLSLAYADITGFPAPTVGGHRGRLVLGEIAGVPVACLQGRVHAYEGYGFDQVVLPIRALNALGPEFLILTNAAGGIREDLLPGTLMLIEDHINFMGGNPLTGPNDDTIGPRFPDMSCVYDAGLRSLARECASRHGIPLPGGIYLGTFGPSFETPAEIRAFQALGADAVGMSTVPEAIAGRHAGLRVGAISCITNRAAGLSDSPLSEDEVYETAHKARPAFTKLLREWILAAAGAGGKAGDG